MSKSRSVGTKLSVGGKVVGSLTNIGGLELSSETTDVTALDNADGYKEFLGGFKDGGEVSAEGFLDGGNEGQEAAMEAFESQEPVACSIDFPAKIGKSWKFNAVVTRYKAGDAELTGALKFATALKVSGKPSLEATTQAAQTN